MSTSNPSSSWIKSVHYHNGFLALVTGDDNDNPVALLYGDNVPSYIPGLLSAPGLVVGKMSPGSAYHTLIRGKYNYQRVEGKDKVRELLRLMKGRTVTHER